MGHTPALIIGRSYDVLRMNSLGRGLFSHLQPGTNLLLTMFFDPAARTFFPEWDKVAANAVAGFRMLEGAWPQDFRLQEVLTTAQESREFADLWSRRDARSKADDAKTMRHPAVGELTLQMHTLDIRSAPGQQMVIYHAAPNSPSADALALLGSLVATDAVGDVNNEKKS